MSDLFTNEYEEAKEKWMETRKYHEKVIVAFQDAFELLEKSFIEYMEAWAAFQKQQKLLKLNKSNIRSIKKEE